MFFFPPEKETCTLVFLDYSLTFAKRLRSGNVAYMQIGLIFRCQTCFLKICEAEFGCS